MAKMNFALKYRPKNLDEICSQDEIVGIFKNFIKSNQIPHSIFFGGAGTGKTSFARALANELETLFFEFDGANLKIDEVRKVIPKGALLKPLIFIDEIHRLSKTQQETLLLPMENYDAIFIGASTANPLFALTQAIRSRCCVFEFKPIKNFENILKRVREDEDFEIDDEAKEYLFVSSGGDARAMLNLLEFALLQSRNLTLEILKKIRAYPLGQGVSSSDTHYNLASALIKSLRGSDVDAALYYLARLIEAAESPEFIARRFVIFASEDIGNANPNALNLAVSTMSGVKNIGYPEARIILAQCAVYLASSPKSNSSYKAINKALEYVRSTPPLAIPRYLINNDIKIKEYLYPHDFGGWVEQKYLEKELNFYSSNEIGFEKRLSEWLKMIKQKDEI